MGKYIKEQPIEKLILEPEDHTEEEWKFLQKKFGVENATRIVISNYTLEAYLEEPTTIDEDDWIQAGKYLNDTIRIYQSLGTTGSFALAISLYPLKSRYDDGERTKELYDAIMAIE